MIKMNGKEIHGLQTELNSTVRMSQQQKESDGNVRKELEKIIEELEYRIKNLDM